MLWVSPLRVNSTVYFAGVKYPAEEFSVTVAGVIPLLTERPLSRLMTKFAPVGLRDLSGRKRWKLLARALVIGSPSAQQLAVAAYFGDGDLLGLIGELPHFCNLLGSRSGSLGLD